MLPDGSVLRARYAGQPTRDLFIQRLSDGREKVTVISNSLLKIWNLNKLSGLLGVFNCQGAGTWPLKQGGLEKPIAAPTFPPISDNMCPVSIEFLEEVAGKNWNSDCAAHAFNSGNLT